MSRPVAHLVSVALFVGAGCGRAKPSALGDGGGAAGADGGIREPCSSYAVSPPVAFSESTARADWAGPGYAIALSGGHYVAVWAASELAEGDPKFDVEVLTTDTRGTEVLRRTAIAGLAGSATVRTVEATSDGVGVLWCERPPGQGPRMVFARITAAATLVAPRVELGNCDPQDPGALAWNGSGFGVAWGCAPETLCFARVDENGTLIAPDLRIPVRGVFGVIRMLWDRDRYALAWNETDPTYGANRFAVVATDGSLMAPVVGLSNPAAYALSVFLARSQRGYALAWSTSQGAELLEVDRVGTPMTSPRPFPLAVPGGLAYTGSEHAALFARPTLTDTPASYAFATLDLGGHLISSEAPVSSQELVHRISLHFDGTAFGVFSAEGDESRLFFRRIDCMP